MPTTELSQPSLTGRIDQADGTWFLSQSSGETPEGSLWFHPFPALRVRQYHIERNQRLRRLGFREYATYLNSPLWAWIRRRVMLRDSRTCRVCGGTAHVTHHITYTTPTLCGNDISRLIALCAHCHKAVELDEAGKQRSPRAARRCLKILFREHLAQNPI